jgi:MFS family permease
VLGVVLAAAALQIPAPSAGPLSERPLATALRDGSIRLGMLLVGVPALVFGVVEVLVPLELDHLGATSVGIAATFVVASAIEAFAQVLAGRAADRRGRVWPIRVCLAGALAFVLVLPLPGTALALAAVTTIGSVLTGALNTPAMALLSDSVDAAGIEQGFGFALVNLVWAGGQVVGTIAGGSLAGATSDAVAYLTLAAICAATLGTMARRGRSPALADQRA